MNVRNLLKKEEDADPIKTQEEERPTFLGKKMKLPPIIVMSKTRMRMTFASWVKQRKLKMR